MRKLLCATGVTLLLATAACGSSGDPAVGRYVDGPAGSPCEGEVIELTKEGRIMKGKDEMGTWRREEGKLKVTARGETLEATEKDDSLIVEGDAITRCK